VSVWPRSTTLIVRQRVSVSRSRVIAFAGSDPRHISPRSGVSISCSLSKQRWMMRSVFRSGICFAVRFTPTASPEAIFQNLLTTTQIRQIRSPPAHLRNAPPCRLEDSRSGRSRGRQKHRKTVLRRPDGKPGPWRGGRQGGTSSASIPGGGGRRFPSTPAHPSSATHHHSTRDRVFDHTCTSFGEHRPIARWRRSSLSPSPM
jgi:hypothetical protein